MGRTSKFSFPMPGRKGRSQDHSEESLPVEEPKLSKVERLLGTTNLPMNYQNAANQQPLLLRELRKQPSSITLTVYEPTIADGRSEYEPTIPDVPSIPDSLRPRHDIADNRPYNAPPRSLSLSQVHSPTSRLTSEENKSYHPRSQSSGAVTSVQQFRSNRSDTYPGHAYNAIKEKPSAINVRELVHEPSTSNAHKLFPVVENASVQELTNEPYPISGYKPGAGPIERKRPTRLDLSKLFPRPSANPLPTAAKTVTSPSSAGFAHNPPRFPSDVRDPSDLISPSLSIKKTRRLAKKSSTAGLRAGATAVNNRPKTAEAIETKSSKVRISKHWFDGLLEAEDDFNVNTDMDNPSFSLSADRSIRPVEASPPHHHPYTPKFRSGSHYHRPHNVWRPKNVSKAFVSAESEMSAVDYQPQHRTYGQHGPSVAHFCSSDSDTHAVEMLVKLETDEPGLPDVRASIALSEVDDELVTIGEAQAFHVRPQRSLEAVETVEVKRTPQPRKLHVVNASLPPSISQNTTPIMSPKDAATNFHPDSCSDYLQSGIVNANDASRSRPESLAARASSILTHASHFSDSKHKMMAVTAEEEALLDMMRQKRAAMQSHSFAEGYKTAMMTSPQTPSFACDQLKSGGLSINSSKQCTFNSEAHLVSPASDLFVTSHSLQEQRRDSEPVVVVAPKPNRVFKLQSTPSISACDVSKSYQSSEANHVSIPEDKFSSIPEMAPSDLSNSPSEGSGMSALPSPVTPHSISSRTPAQVPLTVDFANMDLSHNFADIAEAESVGLLQVDGVLSYSNTSKVSSLNEPRIVQQYRRFISGYESDDCEDVGQLCAFAGGPKLHKHNQGCCGSANVRCSVADDVMAAWSSLGGFQEIERYRLY